MHRSRISTRSVTARFRHIVHVLLLRRTSGPSIYSDPPAPGMELHHNESNQRVLSTNPNNTSEGSTESSESSTMEEAPNQVDALNQPQGDGLAVLLPETALDEPTLDFLQYTGESAMGDMGDMVDVASSPSNLNTPSTHLEDEETDGEVGTNQEGSSVVISPEESSVNEVSQPAATSKETILEEDDGDRLRVASTRDGKSEQVMGFVGKIISEEVAKDSLQAASTRDGEPEQVMGFVGKIISEEDDGDKLQAAASPDSEDEPEQVKGYMEEGSENSKSSVEAPSTRQAPTEFERPTSTEYSPQQGLEYTEYKPDPQSKNISMSEEDSEEKGTLPQPESQPSEAAMPSSAPAGADDDQQNSAHFYFFIYFYPYDTDDGLMPFRKHLFLHGASQEANSKERSQLSKDFADAFTDRRLKSIEVQCQVAIKICHVNKWVPENGFLPNRRVVMLAQNYEKIASALSMMETLMPECFTFARFPQRLPIHTNRWSTNTNFLVRPIVSAKLFRQRMKHNVLADRSWKLNILPERIFPPTKALHPIADDASVYKRPKVTLSSEKILEVGQMKSTMFEAITGRMRNAELITTMNQHNMNSWQREPDPDGRRIDEGVNMRQPTCYSIQHPSSQPTLHQDNKTVPRQRNIKFPATRFTRHLLEVDSNGVRRNPQLHLLEKLCSCSIVEVMKLIEKGERQCPYYKVRVQYENVADFRQFCAFFGFPNRKRHQRSPSRIS